MTEAATDETTEPIVCEHERCAVVTVTMKAEFRKNGEPDHESAERTLTQVHGEHHAQVWLDLIQQMQQAVFAEAEYAVDRLHLPPEVVALVMSDNEIEVQVRSKDGKRE